MPYLIDIVVTVIVILCIAYTAIKLFQADDQVQKQLDEIYRKRKQD